MVEDADEEKLAPADKAWLAVKYLNNAYQSKVILLSQWDRVIRLRLETL